MMILNKFKNYNLTNGQYNLLKMLNKFLEDDTRCFIIKGYAGTGKTFMMKCLVEYLKTIKRHYVLAAPTGRAARILSKYTNSLANTIHKTIYECDKLDISFSKSTIDPQTRLFESESNDNIDNIKLTYELKILNEDPADTVYIFDEASMISDVNSENDLFMFGSGCLLTDIFNYIHLCSHNKRKIIFVGDNAQLPPINMNFSPALNEEYLLKKFNASVISCELTEIVRQKNNSGILKNSFKIRDSLKNNIFNELDINTTDEDIISIKHHELLQKYLQSCERKIDDETIIIAYTNSSVKQYNDYVRNHFFPHQETITKGDKIILVKNNYNYQIELFNGDVGYVQEVSHNNETYHIPLKRKDKTGKTVTIQVPLYFRDVEIQFRDSDFNTHNVKCKIIENLLYSNQPNLSRDELIALFLLVKNFKFPKKQPSKKYFENEKEYKRAFKDYWIELTEFLKTDPHYNALWIKYGYAITCHKAQGGEWKRVFLDCKSSMGYLNTHYFRWLYTAITRAKETLYTINEPHFTIGSNLKPPSVINLKARDDVLLLQPNVFESNLAYNFSEDQNNLMAIFYAVFDLLKDDGISIDNIKHLLWCEDYTFSKDTGKALVKIYYNKQNKISNIQIPENSVLSNFLYQKLQFLVNKTIVINSEEEIQNENIKEFDFVEPFLREFYTFILSKVTPEGINISDIKQGQWLQKYIFKKGNLLAEIDFYYNKKKQFKNIVPQPLKSTSDELLKKIISLIGNLQ